jgi:hypothetical protein
MFEVWGVTDTAATGTGGGTATLRAEPAVLPSLVAEIIAVPCPTALTLPSWVTAATAWFDVCQLTALPTICVPAESLSVAVACAVCPTRRDEGLMTTVTLAIGVGGGGVIDIVAWPATPSLTALTTVVPGATPTIMPASLTVATVVLELNQLTARSGSGAPFASLGTATPRTDWPVASDSGIDIETDATRAGALSFVSTTDVP